MATEIKSAWANTNSTTDVDLVAGPSSGRAVVRYINVYNADTVAATVTLKVDDNGTEYILVKRTLQPGESLIMGGADGELIALNASTKKIQVVLAAAVTTNQLQCVATYLEVT